MAEKEQDDRKKPTEPNPPDFPGGSMNSEHESETSGMRRSARIENKDPGQTLQEDPAGRKPVIPRVTSYTESEQELDEDGHLAMRTPGEMSQHEALDWARKGKFPEEHSTPEETGEGEEGKD